MLLLIYLGQIHEKRVVGSIPVTHSFHLDHFFFFNVKDYITVFFAFFNLIKLVFAFLSHGHTRCLLLFFVVFICCFYLLFFCCCFFVDFLSCFWEGWGGKILLIICWINHSKITHVRLLGIKHISIQYQTQQTKQDIPLISII